MRLPNEYYLLINIPNEMLGLPWTENKQDILNRINWGIVFHIAKYHKLQPAVYLTYSEIMPPQILDKFRQNFEEWQKTMNAVLETAICVNEIANNNQLTYIIHKGIAFSEILYDNPWFRCSSDIDLLIYEPQALEFDSLLRKNGFMPYYFDRNKKTKQLLPYPLHKRSGHHELCLYTEHITDYQISLELGISLHSLTSEETKIFFNHIQYSKKTGLPVYSIEYVFLAMCENIFNNSEYFNGVVSGEATLRDYIDLYVFLYRYGEIINFSEHEKSSVLDKLLYEAAIVLDNLTLLYGPHIPENIKKMVEKAKRPYDLMEIHWQSSFISRLFNKKTEYREFLLHMKSYCYSVNTDNPTVNVYGQPRDELCVQSFRYPFNILVRPYNVNGLIIFELVLDKLFMEFFADFILEVRILHKHSEDPIFLSVACLTFEDSQINCEKYHSESFSYSTIKRRLTEEFTSENIQCCKRLLDDGRISTEICFNKAEIGIYHSNDDFCAQVFLFERMYKDHYYMVSGTDRDLFDFYRFVCVQ